MPRPDTPGAAAVAPTRHSDTRDREVAYLAPPHRTTEGGRSMRTHHARLAGIAVCAVALIAGPASAETQTFTTPGATTVTLPTGVARVHVVAVGGRGGGALGDH